MNDTRLASVDTGGSFLKNCSDNEFSGEENRKTRRESSSSSAFRNRAWTWKGFLRTAFKGQHVPHSNHDERFSTTILFCTLKIKIAFVFQTNFFKIFQTHTHAKVPWSTWPKFYSFAPFFAKQWPVNRFKKPQKFLNVNFLKSSKNYNPVHLKLPRVLCFWYKAMTNNWVWCNCTNLAVRKCIAYESSRTI